MFSEQAVTFSCASDQLLGIIAHPEQAKRTGILIIVGGPQYRTGSHRQFLYLARTLAISGYPVMRFDYRGMGDSTGKLHNFEAVNADIAAAIDTFMAACPKLEHVVLWGLCDAASASLLYFHAHKDERLSGFVLLNPWVRSVATLARTQIKHYYVRRLLQAEFWRKILSGKLGVGRAFGGLLGNLNRVRQTARPVDNELSFQEKMRCALAETELPALLILSGDDYTAKEFIETMRMDSVWQDVIAQKRVTVHEISGADHTFSSGEMRGEVQNITRQWLEAKVGP